MKRTQRSLAIIAILVHLAALPGCITSYRGHPTGASAPQKKFEGTLHYRIRGGSMFSGDDALKRVMKRETPFALVERTDSDVARGVFLKVRIQTLPPSAPAMIFTYISYALLGLIPTWSTQDGYEIFYEIFRDGELVKSYAYDVRRTTFFWLVVLPFSWISLALPSESEAFEATAYDFFRQSESVFAEGG